MIVLDTKYFGKLEIEDSMIIDFELGIPGFLDEKKFIILSEKEKSIFCWLQSVTNPELTLVLVDVFSIIKDYNLIIEEEILDIGEKKDIIVFSVATISNDINESTINLRAPIVINQKNKKGKQIILNNRDYSLRYKFIDHIKNI